MVINICSQYIHEIDVPQKHLQTVHTHLTQLYNVVNYISLRAVTDKAHFTSAHSDKRISQYKCLTRLDDLLYY